MGLFSSKATQGEEYDYEDFTSKQLPHFPSAQHVDRQETSTYDGLSTLITVGVAFVAANLFLAIALKPERHKLENNAMCGMPTGGEVRNNNIGHLTAVQPFSFLLANIHNESPHVNLDH